MANKPKKQPQAAPDFIPAEDSAPDFIPAEPSTAVEGATPNEFTQPAAPSLLHQAGDAITDAYTGASKGLLNTTIAGPARLIHSLPVVGPRIIPDQGLNALTQSLEPTNTAERVGHTLEQGAEFMVPGMGEEAAANLALKIPKIGRFAAPVARIATTALESGALNSLQGGKFKTGAAGGAAGAGAGEVMRAAAPAIAESALGISKRMRGYGKTPGLAALEETRGIRPSTIEKSAQSVIKPLTSDINSMAAAHPGMINMRPALQVIDDRAAQAAAENTPNIATQLGDMRGMLTKRYSTGAPIAADVPAMDALNLKRGLRKEYVGNWNPEIHAEMPGVAKRSSGAIDRELDTALGPEFASENQRISSLLPVAEGAESVSRNAGLMQRAAHRIAAHTGAATMGALGGLEGYREGGIKGGILGAAGGVLIPEAVSSPAVRMLGARMLYSRPLRRFGTGMVLQIGRPSQPDQPGY